MRAAITEERFDGLTDSPAGRGPTCTGRGAPQPPRAGPQRATRAGRRALTGTLPPSPWAPPGASA